MKDLSENTLDTDLLKGYIRILSYKNFRNSRGSTKHFTFCNSKPSSPYVSSFSILSRNTKAILPAKKKVIMQMCGKILSLCRLAIRGKFRSNTIRWKKCSRWQPLQLLASKRSNGHFPRKFFLVFPTHGIILTLQLQDSKASFSTNTPQSKWPKAYGIFRKSVLQNNLSKSFSTKLH